MKRGHKEGTSALCYIDGHPPHSEVRVHPGECSKEQFQEWSYFVLHKFVHRQCFLEFRTDDMSASETIASFDPELTPGRRSCERTRRWMRGAFFGHGSN